VFCSLSHVLERSGKKLFWGGHVATFCCAVIPTAREFEEQWAESDGNTGLAATPEGKIANALSGFRRANTWVT